MKSSLQPGMTLQGRYKILERIGSGGMGNVFKVRALHLNKDYALKEMQDNFVDPDEREKITAQFKNEAQTLAKLDHPGIPHILDTFEENDKHYLVMEFINGQTLEDYVMNADDYLQQGQVLGWIWQIVDVLGYLHNLPEPVIVRDLKPANIMVEADGKIKIIDFGIAKIFETKTSHTKTRIKGSGSSGFAPPEQYGSQGTDVRSDIYSLGVTIYYLMTRTILPDSVDRILNGGQYDRMGNLNTAVTHPFERMVSKMVMLKPEERFQNISQLHEYLSDNNLNGQFMPVTIKKIHTIMPTSAQREEKAKEVDKWKEQYNTYNSQTSKTEAPRKESGSLLRRPEPSGIRLESNEEEPKARQESSSQEEATQESLGGIDPNLSKARARYMSEAMRPKMPTPETAKATDSKPAMAVIITIIVILFMGLGGFLVYKFTKIVTPEPIATVTPEPLPSETEPPKPYTEKIVDGDISKIEIGTNDVKLRVDTVDGYVNFVIAKKDLPANVKAKAEVQISYRIPKDSSKARQPWQISNITVTKEAPQSVVAPPIHKTPKPVQTQTKAPAPVRTYQPPPPAYNPPPKRSTPPPAPAPAPKDDGNMSSGSFKQPKTNY